MRLITLAQKTLRYLKKNGACQTLKKISRRISGNNWLPEDEDALYEEKPYQPSARELWHMPEQLKEFPGIVSVIIPAYNGAHELPKLLEELKRQTGVGGVELVVVDSGSADDTAVLAERAGAKVIRITQAEFSHSYSRSLGAEKATGDYLLFMTQDAMPKGGDWIIRLMQPALLDGAAAVSCYEQPQANADLFSRVAAWMWNRLMSGNADRITVMPEDTGYESLRRCAQLTDNACLVRRDVYKKLGGHKGAYAEDLELGIRMLREGYKLAILSSVSVIHSHSRPPLYYFKRAVVDAINISALFPDYNLDSLNLCSAVSRIAVAAGADILYLRQLPVCAGTGEEFAKHTREIFERNITALRCMKAEEMAYLLFQSGELNEAVRPFMEELWQAGGELYRFDAAMAVSQARYIMHYVCPYLNAEEIKVDEKIKEEIPLLLWQYFAQSAGYTVAACFLNAPDKEGKVKNLVKRYQVGV